MRLQVLVWFVLFVGLANALSSETILEEEWQTFKLTHGKTYKSVEEEKFRFMIYTENKLYIAKHNQLFAKGEVSFALAVNKFADLLEHEFSELMNGYNHTASQEYLSKGASFVAPEYLTLPQTVDWRTKGAVTEVKNQGPCGSCWAFASTGSLEGQTFRKTHRLISLSEQNLIDCSKSFGNNGCHGGFMTNSYQYIKVNRGIDTERSYPYEARDNNCRFNRANVGSTDLGFVNLPSGDENRLLQAVAALGPISVAIDAGHRSFQFYSHGVYNEPACSPRNLNHGVLVVGYGAEGNQNYWLVKNSWSAHWGDAGYIKMSRNRGNQCGIASAANYPLV